MKKEIEYRLKIEHDVKICIDPDCSVVVLNKDWEETRCRTCGMRLVKITAKTFNKKFQNNRQVLFLDV